MDACGMWFSGQVDLAQVSQGRKLYWLADDHNQNVTKYYPDTIETPKGHLNQTRKNVCSTKPVLLPFEVSDAITLRFKKQRDVFTKVYDVRKTIFSDQTG